MKTRGVGGGRNVGLEKFPRRATIDDVAKEKYGTMGRKCYVIARKQHSEKPLGVQSEYCYGGR